jgi:flavin-dependent thymidylate synthase
VTKEIQKWADEAMFTAEPSDAYEGPKVYLLQGTPDPLGSVAAFSAMYTGKVVRDKRDVTDEERRYHLEEMKKTKLKAPLEAVNLHWMVEGVTRSFTHQMVRQRTAVYAQESLRFAVKEDVAQAVALPPSLAGVEPYDGDGFPTDQQTWLSSWDDVVLHIEEAYLNLVNSGMPAEDARGLLPHNITTRLNYATNLRNFQDHAGNRLCTQAQFEWRNVWTAFLMAMRTYCTAPVHQKILAEEGSVGVHQTRPDLCDNWQWNEIANLFRPVCYLTGQCEFKAQFDRKCKIRGRVDANANVNRPSELWHMDQRDETGHTVFIGAISPAEWLMDDGAAR